MKGEPPQQMLTTFLGNPVDLYAIFSAHFARATEEAEQAAEDGGRARAMMGDLFEIGNEARKRLNERNHSVAP